MAGDYAATALVTSLSHPATCHQERPRGPGLSPLPRAAERPLERGQSGVGPRHPRHFPSDSAPSLPTKYYPPRPADSYRLHSRRGSYHAAPDGTPAPHASVIVARKPSHAADRARPVLTAERAGGRPTRHTAHPGRG